MGEGYIRVENTKCAWLMAALRNRGRVWGYGRAGGQLCRRSVD